MNPTQFGHALNFPKKAQAMSVEATSAPDVEKEYILVTDKDSKIIKSGPYSELKTLAGIIRKAGGEVTIFKSTRG